MQPHEELDPTLDLEPNEDIIERAGTGTSDGEEPLWLWTQTCPLVDCPCRAVLVVAANDRAQLDAHVAIVRDAWDEAEDAAAFNAVVPADIIAFELDIDSGSVSMPLEETPILTPAVERIAARIDGELLDRLASQWHLGKELEDLATIPVQPADIREYETGQLLAWDEVYEGARMDVYPEGSGAIEAIETYCVRPKCECLDVHVQFYQLPDMHDDDQDDEQTDDGQDDDEQTDDHDDDDHVFVGTVSIKLEDPVQVAYLPDSDKKDLLEQVFLRYQARYPNWIARLADRAEKMAAFGEKLHAHLEQKRRKPWVSPSRKRKGKRN